MLCSVKIYLIAQIIKTKFCIVYMYFLFYLSFIITRVREKDKTNFIVIHISVRHSLTFPLNRRHPCLHVLTQLAFKLVAHPTELHGVARVRGRARGNMRLIKKVSVSTAMDCKRQNIHIHG